LVALEKPRCAWDAELVEVGVESGRPHRHRRQGDEKKDPAKTGRVLLLVRGPQVPVSRRTGGAAVPSS
jgi:hypothetical protein